MRSARYCLVFLFQIGALLFRILAWINDAILLFAYALSFVQWLEF